MEQLLPSGLIFYPKGFWGLGDGFTHRLALVLPKVSPGVTRAQALAPRSWTRFTTKLDSHFAGVQARLGQVVPSRRCVPSAPSWLIHSPPKQQQPPPSPNGGGGPASRRMQGVI